MTGQLIFRIAGLLVIAVITLFACGTPDSSASEVDIPSGEKDSVSLADLDHELATMYNRMWDERRSLPYQFADTFEMKLEAALQNPEAFAYPFDSLQAANVRMVVSTDSLVRLFTWSSPWSGTLSIANVIFQYRTKRGSYVVYNIQRYYGEDDKVGIPFPSRLSPIVDSLYLTVSAGRIMSRMPYQDISCLVLSDTGLAVADMKFHVADTILGSVSLDKNWYYESGDEFDGEMPDIVEYDPTTKILSFPEIIDTVTGEFYNGVSGTKNIQRSGRTIRLKFNGKYFEPVGE